MNTAGNPTLSDAPPARDAPAQPQTWLFHVFSCDAPGAPLGPAHPLDSFDEITLGRGEPTAATTIDGGRRQLRLGFTDAWMSVRHARIERVVGGYWLSDIGSRNGVRLNGTRTEGALLVDGDWIEAGHSVLRYRHGELFPSRHPSQHLPLHPTAPSTHATALMTSVPSLAERVRDLERIARSTVSVVLRGETGTGKEVLTRAVHRISGRPGELIAVNCGALPASLLESELFGYRKGAFSNATEDRPGLIRAADRGTLFLDEIGDLPATSQAALLRVLQEGEVLPIGGTRPIKVDLRVVCATHRDLEAEVARGQFRADLYARLAGHTFAIPPLRDRLEDLGLLVAALLARIAPERELRFEPDAVRALCQHRWPFNIRELEKCLASAVLLARGGAIDAATLTAALMPAALNTAQPAPAATLPASPPLATGSVPAPRQARTERRQQLEAALIAHHGNVSAVARALGKARSQVQRWLHDYQIDPARYR